MDKKSKSGGAKQDLKKPVAADEAEEEHFHQVEQQLVDAQVSFVEEVPTVAPGIIDTWKVAASLVSEFRPVPPVLWRVIHSVYGKKSEIQKMESAVFSPMQPLILRAAKDPVLGDPSKFEDKKDVYLAEAVSVIGVDVAAALCFMYAVCRRVSASLIRRLWRPIVDDALIRSLLGYHVGVQSVKISRGQGMLAGFAGRCGFAIQVAAGDEEQCAEAFSELASGADMSEVCTGIYNCEPLQVSAMALIAAGCSKDMAMGVAAYSMGDQAERFGKRDFPWLELFSTVEELRMAREDKVKPGYWGLLGIKPDVKPSLIKKVDKILRRGHTWHWLTIPQLVAGDIIYEDDEEDDDD